MRFPTKPRHNVGLAFAVATTFVAAAFPAFGAPKAANAAASEATAVALYKKSLAASETVTYSGRQFITTWHGGDQSTTVITRVDHQAPSDYRMTLLAPPSRAGRAIVEDTYWQWTYSPTDGVVIKSAKPLTARDATEIPLLLANYTLSVDPVPVQIAGRKTYLVTITSKSRGGRMMHYWIDAYTGLALRMERYHAGGGAASVSYFSEINYHPTFAAATFGPSQWPKASMKYAAVAPVPAQPLAQQRISESLHGHAIIPPRVGEFHLTSITSMPGSRQTVHLHYSDGLSSLSLFETLKANRLATRVPHTRITQIDSRRVGHASQQYSYTVLSWDEGRLNLTLVGDTNIATLRNLATLVSNSPAAKQ